MPAFPPWPLTIRMRRKPCCTSEATMSSATAISVSALRVTLPGKRMWCAEKPNQGGGSTAGVAGARRRRQGNGMGEHGVGAEWHMVVRAARPSPRGSMTTVRSRSSAATSGELSSSHRIHASMSIVERPRAQSISRRIYRPVQATQKRLQLISIGSYSSATKPYVNDHLMAAPIRARGRTDRKGESR